MMKKQIKELFQFRELLFNLVINELKLRYRNSILGFLWTILNPLFYLLILALVFSKIIKFQIPNYTIFLFAGLTSWLMIQQTVTIATASIVNNQALIRRVYVPKMVFPLSNVFSRYIDHTILTVILLVFMVIFKVPFTWSLLFIPVIVLMIFFFSLGLSLITTVAQIKIRDVQHIVSIIFQILFYTTPIIYPLEILPAKYQPLLLWNPFFYFVQCFRFPIYYSSLPPLNLFLVALALTILAFAFGFILFYKKEKYFVYQLS
jgi:ABC-type polysaccharide/polyol phosphate export permease